VIFTARSERYPLNHRADYETDAVIQQSLRKELPKDVTVLTVAHRLRTIMDSDKIVSIHAHAEEAGC
jgi:ABC-type multidrug transport system fused ATPase/permease subunit